MRIAVGRAFGERVHRVGHRREQLGDRQLGAELVQLGQIEAQRHLGLAGQRAAHRVGADVGVAVAVAADPVAHAKERRHLVPAEFAFDLGIQPRQLAQKRHRVVRQRVLHLVGHRELGVAQHARLPQLRDARADRGLVVLALARRVETVAFTHQPRDREFGIEDALALHLGGVRGQHRRDVRMRQGGRHLRRLDARAGEPLETHRQRPRVLVAGTLVNAATAHVVAILRDVGQVAEVAERADHAHRLVGRQALEELRQVAPGVVVALEPVGHRELADAFDQLVRLLAFLLADHLAEDAPEQPDVLHQRRVFGRGVVAAAAGRRWSRGSWHGCGAGSAGSDRHGHADAIYRPAAGTSAGPMAVIDRARVCGTGA